MKSKISLLLLVLSLTTPAFAQLFGGPGFGYRPDPDHIPKDPFKKDYFRVSACALEANGKTYQLNEAAESYTRALELLDLTPSGHDLLLQFNALNAKSPYKFTELYTELRRQMGFPVKIGAAYVFDGKSQTVYYDPQDDLGLLALFLAHELTHAIDPDVPKSYFEETDAYKKLSKDEFTKLRQSNSFRIERRAFDMQDKVYPELMRLSPCYENFIQAHRDGEELKLFKVTPDSFIKSAYGIP